MKHAVVAMDTFFHGASPGYPLRTRLEMIKAAGFDAGYFTNWPTSAADAERQQLASTAQAVGFDIAAVYAAIDLAEGHDACLRRVEAIARDLPEGADFELALKHGVPGSDQSSPDDPKHDEKAVRLVLALAERTDATICLYPHVRVWMQRHATALRVVEACEHPRVKIMFCGYHWYAADDRDGLDTLVPKLAPHLHAINLCGVAVRGEAASILPLGDGQMDNAMVLGRLRSLGFEDRIAIQGYSLRGDVFARLQQARVASEQLVQQVEAHAAWYTAE
ncbi:MAG: TIM barrel protein [Planctomycetota bacterium]